MKSEKKKLLLIEDDKIDQKAFKRFADQPEFPYDYNISGSVKEAKKTLKAKKYDVILADYSLGDGTAFDILKAVNNTPIVIITGTGDEEVAVKAMKLGAYDYIIKDIEGNYLKMVPAIAGNSINRFQTEQELQEYHENLEKLVDKRTAELKKEITERKQAEEELENYRDHLEELVKERTKEIEAFTYSVSHDLRAPLRAISGFSEILSDDYKDKLDDEAIRLINVIRKNALNMNKLIIDLLDFSHIGRQKLKMGKINMKNIAAVVFDELRQIYPKRDIKFKLGEIPSAMGDRNLIRLVFINLISNAIKFSEHKKVAEIEIGFRKKDNQEFYYVKDNGVGFNMDYVDKIFGVFQRLHSAKEFEGTGVGLAIVQKIIQNHGGEIWAKGEVDKGATIYFSLQKNS